MVAQEQSMDISPTPFHPSAQNISISGKNFVDEHGRVLDLRGANVGSASKVPLRPCPPFHDHAQASYVGRPFPLHEAEEQFRRLRHWGLTFLRINVTWEALEHAGPGQYDQAYLDYLKDLLVIMHKCGVVAYIVIHQDVFSRYCGGSGAPGWVVEAAGFDLSDDGDKLALSGSAFLDGIRGGRLQGERGLWPTGYQKLACATMCTLFWGGETFAPSFKVKGRDGKMVNIQKYLQDAFLAAVDKLVETVGHLDGVMGFELMNEPHPGYIGVPTVHGWNYNTDLHLGQFPSPLQSFSMGAGHPTPSVPFYVRTFPWPTRISKYITANPTGACVWRSDGPTKGECPWEREGVWRWSEKKGVAMAMQEDYFTKDRSGRKIDFYEDFYFPFVKRWDAMLEKRGKAKRKVRLVEGVPNEYCPAWPAKDRPREFVYTPHWYDLNAMFKKQFGVMTVNVQGLSRGMFFAKALYFGREAAKKNYALQISTLVKEARRRLGDVPIVFGECGVPMDLNDEEHFRTGDWKWPERMMDSLLSALEASLVGFNIWAFNPHNRDDVGDDWNAENFSWYSNIERDAALAKRQMLPGVVDYDAGGRMLDVIVRPYAIATCGSPISLQYDYRASTFTYRWAGPARPVPRDAKPSPGDITEIFLPSHSFSASRSQWTISPGGRVVFDWENQRAYIWFVDEAWRSSKLPQSTRIRRFDIWDPAKADTGIPTWKVLVAVVVICLTMYLAYFLQMLEWNNELGMGLRPYVLEKLQEHGLFGNVRRVEL